MASSNTDTELEHGLVIPNWEVNGETDRLVEYAVAAEAAGWDGVFFADHLVFPPRQPGDERAEHGPFPDPWITMAGIASRTGEIRLGSWVTPIARRQPWQVARDTATLDRLSDGRVILGTGLGRSTDYTTFGEEWNPKRIAARYDEALDIIDSLWQGEPVNYAGDHFTVEEAVVRPTPVQEPRIPVIVGGFWPNKKPFHRGARWDGMIPHYPGDGSVPTDGVEGLVPATDMHAEAVVEEMVDYYRAVCDTPGDVYLPVPPEHLEEWVEICERLDVSWMITRPKAEYGEWNLTMEQVNAGPPG